MNNARQRRACFNRTVLWLSQTLTLISVRMHVTRRDPFFFIKGTAARQTVDDIDALLPNAVKDG